MPPEPILSHFQVKSILEAREGEQTESLCSLDLGLTTSRVVITGEGLQLPDGQVVTWRSLEVIAQDENACFVITAGEPSRIQFYSEALSRAYTLMPTQGAPTLLVSGIPMHRIKGVDPHQDTRLKIKAIAPVTGLVLDTATGLGYTAIQAAGTAEHVITIELDPTVIEICRLNPWSLSLFDHPRIEQRIGDSYEEITSFADETFSIIIHDPPTLSLAGDLYGVSFYRQLHRTLRQRGRLFHYIGDPQSRSGAGVTRGVVRRLQEAGFRRVGGRPQAFGVVAYK